MGKEKSFQVWNLFDLSEEKRLSNPLEPYDAIRFRAMRRGHMLANFLLNEEGKLSKEHLSLALQGLKKQPYCHYPDSPGDRDLCDHMLRALRHLHTSIEAKKILEKFSLPFSSPLIESAVRYALQLSKKSKVTTRDFRAAVLSALLTPLRQNVGSCFATAPAILIQSEQMNLFLHDLYELTSRNQLNRTMGGKMFSVPICPTWGRVPRDFPLDHPLLKIWEFTLASFSDYKTEFYKWNMYAGLGFDSQEQGGLGELLHSHLEKVLERANEKTRELHEEYERAVDQVRLTQALIRQATSSDKMRTLKAQLTANVQHMDACQDLRDKSDSLAKNYSTFLQFLVEQYSEKFTEYFQEVYDPEMFEPNPELYDDSPAGFRLVYKHGRQNPNLWTHIYTAEEYIKALESFFVACEGDIVHACEWEQGKNEVVHISTLIIHHLRTDEFLKSAIARIERLHEKAGVGRLHEKRTPWSYVSGGTMHTLVKAYYCLERDLSEEGRWIESPTDLLVYLCDLLKAVPHRETKAFAKEPYRSMLMQSPTHAFLLKPGLEFFESAWSDRGFSYTWVRDELILPAQLFYRNTFLGQDQQDILIEQLFQEPFFSKASIVSVKSSPEKLRPAEFRELIFHQFAPHFKPVKPSTSQIILDQIDGFLRAMLPLTPLEEVTKALPQLKHLSKPFISYRQLHQHLIDTKEMLSSQDWHQSIYEKCFSLGFAMPRHLMFADTNWGQFYFSFVVNPGTSELELWRTDSIGLYGLPMSNWRIWLNGEDKKHWTLYTSPREYSAGALPTNLLEMVDKRV